MMKRALVLGGGGVAGIAWETGMIVGMAEAGVDVRDADLFLGTSGGSCVAAQMSSDLSLEELFQRQVDPALQAKDLAVDLNFKQMVADYARIVANSRNATEILQRVGALALATPTVSEAVRREVIVSRLPLHSWRQRPLKIVAIDAQSGERRIFDRDSGADLIDVVAASCAVPCVWPTVTVGSRRYVDGGSFANENADLAVGFERVLVLAPDAPVLSVETLDSHLELLRRSGALVDVVHADEATKAVLASVGGNPLDPAVRTLAANAGREQGRRVAARVASLWLDGAVPFSSQKDRK
jgi:NTE family protein